MLFVYRNRNARIYYAKEGPEDTREIEGASVLRVLIYRGTRREGRNENEGSVDKFELG